MSSLPECLSGGSLERALEDDDNVLVQMEYPRLRAEFLDAIEAQKDIIEALVRHHLGFKWCRVVVREAWSSGSFNIVVPIMVPGQRIIYLRLPFPFRIGERHSPGHTEEKLRTEIATYLWLHEHCPDVPIPTLLGFGLPDGSMFTHPTSTPFWERCWWNWRRWILSLIGSPVPTRHVRRATPHPLASGFLLLSQAKGKMLAVSWREHRHDPGHRKNLFRGLAAISASMNAHPLPRIGSLTFCPDATIALCNRPLSLHLQMLENEGIPSGIPRHRTYAEVESYLSDLLSTQDSKIRNQPNAIHSQQDGKMQLAALSALRAVSHHFISPDTRQGPFFYTLTDLQQSNIFVDEDWNIQTVIDLEWAHSMPLEMQLPPYWLTSRAVDQFHDASCVSEYETLLEEYLGIYEAEERRRNKPIASEAAVKRRVWKNGGFWYFNAVTIPKGMYNIFNTHVQPLFNAEHPERKVFDDVFFWYWGFGAQDVIDGRIASRERYMESVKKAFAAR